MTLEDRLSFREALLEHRTDEEWKHYRPQHQSFYHGRFCLEGRKVTGSDLISEYVARFPADREYSDKGNLNRMLADCKVPQFSFTDPEVLRGFLLSARTPSQWAKYEPSGHSFVALNFQYRGISVKEQMFLHNCFIELDNQENGTHYAFIDYTTNPKLKRRLDRDCSGKFIAKLFEIAGLKVKHHSIENEKITTDRLREILLSGMSEEEWSRWEGKAEDFYRMRFDLDEYRVFTGSALRRAYENDRVKRFSAKQIFDEAGLAVASDPSMLKKRLEDRFDRYYGVLEDPDEVRNLLLQVRSEDEWRTPQVFSQLRKEKIAIDKRRNITVHSLLHLYSIHKYNSQQDDVRSRIFFNEALKSDLMIQSNKEALGELLDFAGLEYKFVPNVWDVDLHDSSFLRRFLYNGTLDDERLSAKQLTSMPSWKLRKAIFTDLSTGLELKGHSLMLYYSALHYVKEHPEVGLETATNELKLGKSNQAVWNEILDKAGF
jgi:hypothetical protein